LAVQCSQNSGHMPEDKQKALDAIGESGFDGNAYGGRTWGIVTVKDAWTFRVMPFQLVFRKIGPTRTKPASDRNGGFLMPGPPYSFARDFARFELLYLNDGVWNDERIPPEG
jgi:hypothetical protein